jgi:hypothetical protein
LISLHEDQWTHNLTPAADPPMPRSFDLRAGLRISLWRSIDCRTYADGFDRFASKLRGPALAAGRRMFFAI